MGSKLFNKAIPFFGFRGKTDSRPEVITNVAWLEKVKGHLITLAFG